MRSISDDDLETHVTTTRPTNPHTQVTRVATLALLAASLLPPAAAQQPLGARLDAAIASNTPQYELVDLGTLGGLSSAANDINEHGVIAGWAQIASGAQRPVLWDQNGVRNLGQPPGFGAGDAIAVNAARQVAIEAESGSPISYGAFLWEAGSWTPLPPLDNRPEAIPEGIDAAGRVVGRSLTLGGSDQRAVLWDLGRVVDLGTLDGTGTSQANGMNDAGQIVGRSSSVFGNRAFLWQDGVMTDLGLLPGDEESAAFGINALGEVVGKSWTTSIPGFLQVDQAALWFGQGALSVDLGTTPVGSSMSTGICAPTGFWTANTALGVNNLGQVVGGARCISSGALKAAFLWHAGRNHNLNDPVVGEHELDLLEARAINDAGQIVGLAVNPAGNLRAFLLNPLPGALGPETPKPPLPTLP